MVLGHCDCPIPYVTQVLYMFHMPLFFFFSGYCFKEQYIRAPKQFVWKRIKGIYWPYVKYSLLFLLFHNVFYALNIYNSKYGTTMGSDHKYGLHDFMFKTYTIITHMNGHDQLLGGYWFLRALFFGSLIAFLLLYLSYFAQSKWGFKKKFLDLIIVLIPLALTIIINYSQVVIPYFHFGAQPSLVAVFFLVGYIFRKYGVPKFNSLYILFGSALVVLGSFFWRSDTNYLYYNNYKMVPYIITAVIGTWCVYSFNWENYGRHLLRVLQFVGNNTLNILTWHFLFFKIVSVIIIFYYNLPVEHLAEFPVMSYYAMRGWWIVYFLFGIGVLLLVSAPRISALKR